MQRLNLIKATKYFSTTILSVRLLTHLADMKICATGTIRDNRTEHCPFPDKKFWAKNPRGSYKFVANDELLLVQWKDNKVVTVASNFEDNTFVNTSRWCRTSKTKKCVQQPLMIANYNKGMGGVDKMDGLISVYRTRMRQRKWYWPIFSYLLDVSVVNGWLLMKDLKPDDSNCASLLLFRRYIAIGLLNKYGVKSKKGKAPSNKTVGINRFDNIGHLINYSETDRRFKICKKKCNFICIKCGIGLHPKFCFLKYHC